VRGGLDILKIDKTPLIYTVSYFSLGGLEHCLGGMSPPNSPVVTALAVPAVHYAG